MPLTNPRQGRKNAKDTLFFECPYTFASDKAWGIAERMGDGSIMLQFCEDESDGRRSRLMQFFDVAALKQLIDWAEGRMVGEPSEDEDDSP